MKKLLVLLMLCVAWSLGADNTIKYGNPVQFNGEDVFMGYKVVFTQSSSSNIASDSTLSSDLVLVDSPLIETITHVYLLTSASDADTSIIYYELYEGTLGSYESNLKGYWNMDEESGTRYDETTNDNDLTDVNSVLYGSGVYNNAGDFESGNTEYLLLADASAADFEFTGTSAFTIAQWVKFESLTDFHMVSKRVANDGWENGLDAPTPNFYLRRRSSSSEEKDLSVAEATAGVWYHFVSTYDGTNIQIYVNGATSGNATASSRSLVDTAADFRLGVGQNNTEFPLDGLLDDVGIWNRALTSDEVATLYTESIAAFAVDWEYTTKIGNLTSGQDNEISELNDTERYKLNVIGSNSLDIRNITMFFK